MKVAIVALALIGLGSAAPQPRKVFHEHFEDFIDIILEEAGDDFNHIFVEYMGNDEFWTTLEYIRTNSFKDLIYEMESLPEFKAVIEFLENDNIDIIYFIDMLNDFIQNVNIERRARHTASGKDFSSYVNDIIDSFPKAKLAALFDQKMADDDEFRAALENLQSDEWDRIFSALWDNEVFQVEVATLAENGIDIRVLFNELKAVFGQ